MNILLKIVVLAAAIQPAAAAVYNCNGTFTDVPCNTKALRVMPANGGAYVPPVASVPAKKEVYNPPIAVIEEPKEPTYCPSLRADLKDARWRKENFIHPGNVAKAVADEKRLVDEIWFKCSRRFE